MKNRICILFIFIMLFAINVFAIPTSAYVVEDTNSFQGLQLQHIPLYMYMHTADWINFYLNDISNHFKKVESSITNFIPWLTIEGAQTADSDYEQFHEISELSFNKDSGFVVTPDSTNSRKLKISLGSAWTELIPNYPSSEYPNLKPTGEEKLSIKMIETNRFGTFWDYSNTNKNEKTFYIGVNSNDFGLKYIYGAESFTNQETSVTNFNTKFFGIKAAESNANIAIQFDPTNSIYELKALGGIPGPQGADGVGNIEWAGTFHEGMIISNENTWVSWNGSIWTPTSVSLDPIYIPPTNNADWKLVVSKGADGKSGKDGSDGLGLQLTDWSTNLQYISPEMLLSYAGYLLVITNDYTIDNPGFPVINSEVQNPYKALVWPGANGADADVYTNAMFVVEFNPLDAVPAHSLVVYDGYLWYAKEDYNPTNGTAIPPSEGNPAWMIIGKQGPRGPQGADGIGNLRYIGAWDQYRTNSLNDIARWIRSSDGRVDWYRAIKDNFISGTYPNPEFWELEISSGTDANTLDWKIVDGPYDYLRPHSNELYRAPSGIVYYTINDVPAGEQYAPGASHGENWSVFVRDGALITGITNGTTNLIWRGLWDESVPYVPGDLVTYQSGNGYALYVNKEECNTISPLNQNYWQAIATGIRGPQGPQGPAGKDGAVTYVTNITTYEHAEFITNITYITNDNKTAIINANSGDILPSVKFTTNYFNYDYSQGMFSLTEAALGVSSLNNRRGNLNIVGTNNISINFDSTNIIISSDGLTGIPIGLTHKKDIESYDTNMVDTLIFDSNSGFNFITNIAGDVIVSLGSSWTTIYDDDMHTNSPTGEEPLRITTHTNNNKVLWAGTTNILIDDEEVPVKILSIGTSGEKGEPGAPGANLVYYGIWTNKEYESNSLVRVNSDLWYALADTFDEPSSESSDWEEFLTTTKFNIQSNGITLNPDQNPEIVSSYDETNNVVTMQFKIPRGELGLTKSPIAGSATTLVPISTNQLAQATVTTGTVTDTTVEFNFGIPAGLPGPQGPVGPSGTNATMRIGDVQSVVPISPTEFGQAYVNMTNEADNTFALYFGIPTGIQGEIGPKGDNGGILVPKGSWTSTNTYYTNEMVRYGNAQYYVINDNDGEGVTGIEPDALGNTNWFVFVQDGEGLAVNATTLFSFDEQDEAIYYATNILLDTNTLMIVNTNMNDVEYSALTVVGGGGGGWNPKNRIATNLVETVLSDDYLIWMDPSIVLTNQILDLPTLDNESQTIVVRQLGNDYSTIIQRIYNNVTNTYYISGNGDGVTIDWLGAMTNWYWRTY